MNFSYHEGEDRVLYRYRLREDQSLEVMSERIQYLFLELPNAVHALEPGATVLEKFCYALHHMKDLERVPEGFTEKLLEMLFESAEIAKFAPEERTKYIYDITTERDILNQIAFAEKKGVARGREEMAKSMIESLLKLGVSPEVLSKATGLSPEEVSCLAIQNS